MSAPPPSTRRTLTPLRSASILLFLLALGRGAGGLVLLLAGERAITEQQVAPDPPLAAVGIMLLVVAALAVLSGWLLWRRARVGILLTIVTIVLFVAGGFINGTLLYGRPVETGAVINLLLAGGIALFLYMGRGEIRARD
ncbi:MAG: hypothetical protein ACE15D_11780 [Candidatus Eisenbacteria bacterium]